MTEEGGTTVHAQEDVGQASVTEKLHRQIPIGATAPMGEYRGHAPMGKHHGGGTNGVDEQTPMGTVKAGAPGAFLGEALRAPPIEAPWVTSGKAPLASSGEAPRAPCGELVRTQSGGADCGDDPALLNVGQELAIVREASTGTGQYQEGSSDGY
ncbi:unnamed protein product [Ilex paraguariensis]|uniref:Uncharacterized protein n=1 Tax=Ilex paraguariensis TaxID=185542 RepID=A0ABC8RKK5_9AQUA